MMLCFGCWSGGIVMVSDSGGLFLSEADLLSVGCGSCVFRLNGRCFYGLGEGDVWDRRIAEKFGVFDEGVHVDGVCPDVMRWLFSLGDSPARVWENYHLFVSRLQASEDYKEFKRVSGEIERLRDGGVGEGDLERLKMKETAARVWWSRGVEGVLRGLGRVADREARRENVDRQVDAVLGLDSLHQIIVGGDKKVEGLPLKDGDDGGG